MRLRRTSGVRPTASRMLLHFMNIARHYVSFFTNERAHQFSMTYTTAPPRRQCNVNGSKQLLAPATGRNKAELSQAKIRTIRVRTLQQLPRDRWCERCSDDRFPCG